MKDIYNAIGIQTVPYDCKQNIRQLHTMFMMSG